MRIGLIADSHDRLPTLQRALSFFKRVQVEAIIHAGDFVAPFAAKLIAPDRLDVPLFSVYGNNDGERKGLKQVLPELVDGPLQIELGGRRIVVHHFIDWLKPTDLARADVVVTGHTHQVVQEQRDGKLFVNPGECCGWVTQSPTVALLDLQTLDVQVIEVHA